MYEKKYRLFFIWKYFLLRTQKAVLAALPKIFLQQAEFAHCAKKMENSLLEKKIPSSKSSSSHEEFSFERFQNCLPRSLKFAAQGWKMMKNYKFSKELLFLQKFHRSRKIQLRNPAEPFCQKTHNKLLNVRKKNKKNTFNKTRIFPHNVPLAIRSAVLKTPLKSVRQTDEGSSLTLWKG